MGLAAFNRMRREQAEREATELAENAIVLEEEKEPTEGEIEGLTLDEVKTKLDELGVKYSHNTGEAKLREKLTKVLEE